MKLEAMTVEDVYQAITSQDEQFVRALAVYAVTSALETQADMWSDDTDAPVPTLEDAKEMASEFFTDMVGDFKSKLTEQIAAVKGNVHLTLRSSLTIEG